MIERLYVGLVHHPVYNRHGEVVTTSVTNLDLHDIPRSCLTFGVKQFFVITPLESQHEMFKRIVGFWESDTGKGYNPDRAEALSIMRFSYSIDETVNMIKKQEEVSPRIVTTTAVKRDDQIGFDELRNIGSEAPVLLLFGTGNGLTEAVHRDAHYVLEPISGMVHYNHLSVRSAAAIVLDRLSSEK